MISRRRRLSYNGLNLEDSVRHVAKLTSDIWQSHPFCEGNTHATAVFIIKYLRTFEFSVSNEAFAANSWHFRNALVRANYNDWQNGTHATAEYLELFFENLLLNKTHELKNRFLHIDYQPESAVQSAKTADSKCNFCTLEELAILQEIKKRPENHAKTVG